MNAPRMQHVLRVGAAMRGERVEAPESIDATGYGRVNIFNRMSVSLFRLACCCCLLGTAARVK